MAFGLVNKFIDQLPVVTTNNYNTIAISAHYNSLERRVYCSQPATRHFLVTASIMVIPLPSLQALFSQTPAQN
jgi:hypothetical protein